MNSHPLTNATKINNLKRKANMRLRSVQNNLKRTRNIASTQVKRVKNLTLQTLLGKFLNSYGIFGNDKTKLVRSWVAYQNAVNIRNIRKNQSAAQIRAVNAGKNLANAAFSINAKTPPPPYDPVRNGLKKGIKGRVVYWAPGILRRSMLGF